MANINGRFSGIYGSSYTYSESLVGTNADDIIDGKGGTDQIDGGAGIDHEVWLSCWLYTRL